MQTSSVERRTIVRQMLDMFVNIQLYGVIAHLDNSSHMSQRS